MSHLYPSVSLPHVVQGVIGQSVQDGAGNGQGSRSMRRDEVQALTETRGEPDYEKRPVTLAYRGWDLAPLQSRGLSPLHKNGLDPESQCMA